MLEIITNAKENHRIIQDDLNGRCYKEEWKCHKCNIWIDEQDVVWATESGKLNTDIGNPYCSDCLPNEEE